MKRTKKFLLGLLATLSVLSGSLGLVACGGDNSSSSAGEATQIEKVYAQYVVYAQAEGQTPLSYEEWLATIKGDKGDKGDTGAQGVGIEKVEFDENGDLLITFTDGTKQTVEMPEQEEHVHTFGEWTVFTAEETFCENRLFFRVCAECNGVEWKQGSYADHDFTTVTTEPTCQAGGYDTKTCEICGKAETINPTPIADHAWATKYSFDNSYHWIDCDTCDEFKNKEEHTVLSSGECSVCKELVGATEGVVYDVSNGEAQVVMYEGTAKRVRIADTYQGAPVTKIGNEAFKNSAITSIVIPDSVTSIGDCAFYNCSSLTSIEIGNGVTTIGDDVFCLCDSLTSITIPTSVTSIGDCAFYYCSGLTSVVIPDSVTSIGSYAFYFCDSLTSITFNGTKAQWNAIEKGSYWNDDAPAKKVVCSDGEVFFSNWTDWN